MQPKIRLKGFSGNWHPHTIKDICEVNPRAALPEEFEYVDLESVVGTAMISHRTEKRESAPSRAQRLARKGDIFYQTVRPYQKNNYLFEKDETNYVFSTGYAQLRTKINQGYLFTLMQSSSFVNKVLLECTGTSYPAINPTNLSKIKIDIVDNEDIQKAIASYFLHLDSLIQSTTKKIESLKQVKAASLQSMFPQEGETTPRVRIGTGISPWKECKLDEILVQRHEVSTITQDLPQLSFTIAEGIIRPEDRKSNQRDFLIKDKDNKRYLITRVGDIIYNPANVVYGAIHRNSLADGVVSPIYRIFSTNQDSKFIECVVRRPSFISQLAMRTEGTVTKLKTLKPEAFLDMTVCIPSDMKEQRLIGEYFRNLDSQITLQTLRLEKLKQIKAACLDNMFV